MSFKGIIFDMDGTLVDSMGMWRGLATIFLAHNGLCPKEEGLNEKVYHQMSISEMKDFFEKEYGLWYPDVKSFQDAYYRAIDPYYQNIIKPIPHVFDFLKLAKDEGFRMCVATATRTRSAMLALERLGFMQYMEFVICCDDVGAGKNRPDIYLEAARRLGYAVSECVVFEDAYYCARTAVNAGFYTVGIFEKNAPGEELPMRQICSKYIMGYDDLLEQNSNKSFFQPATDKNL